MSKFKKFKIFSYMFIIIFLTIAVIIFISGYFSERVNYYVAQKVKINSNLLFEQAIREAVIPNIDIEEILLISYGENKNVENVVVNTKEVNIIMAKTLEVINELFLKIENNMELTNLTLPLGIILSDTLFQNMGPNIHVKIRPVGSYKLDLVTMADAFGINNSLLQVLLILQIDFITLIPFNSQNVTVDIKVPLVIEIINGIVPRYYYYLHNYEPGPTIPEIED